MTSHSGSTKPSRETRTISFIFKTLRTLVHYFRAQLPLKSRLFNALRTLCKNTGMGGAGAQFSPAHEQSAFRWRNYAAALGASGRALVK